VAGPWSRAKTMGRLGQMTNISIAKLDNAIEFIDAQLDSPLINKSTKLLMISIKFLFEARKSIILSDESINVDADVCDGLFMKYSDTMRKVFTDHTNTDLLQIQILTYDALQLILSKVVRDE
jgi:hypothetical protein